MNHRYICARCGCGGDAFGHWWHAVGPSGRTCGRRFVLVPRDASDDVKREAVARADADDAAVSP
jgi:hypothetical protein